ncbi:serine/threonine-protein phosphatase 7 long form homolog [Arachis duranensis]|uniref:Serine/threonine-protein phosphatase 7 long form homolog n=1 Tax=Arachis duranensis TaxID=130453 RepID=A0A6P4DK71_ARADU|nr:serine/threonine-protein phosphatase 7 long form homolog [Arachis duranensis]
MVRDITRSEDHIIEYLAHPTYGSRILECRHLNPPDTFDASVEELLRETGFYHISRVGRIQSHSVIVTALVERWRPETHTFHLPIGECTITLEDVAMILGLPTNGLPVTGPTDSSSSGLESECMWHFGVAPGVRDHRGSFIKLTWLRSLKRRLQLNDQLSRERYVKCHIMALFGTTLFCDKSGAGVHWKFLPLLRNVSEIKTYSWGAACLAHLYRSLCRASRYDCKDMDGPLTLLHVWAWERMPFLAPIPIEPRFPLAQRWNDWEFPSSQYRHWTTNHVRKLLDLIQPDRFVWDVYSHERIAPHLVPDDIREHEVIWNATTPLISFECIEWHPADRVKRQFGLQQDIPGQPKSLGNAHGNVLTGPKNLNWAVAHSEWITIWANRYSHILGGDPVKTCQASEVYMSWYNATYGNHLQLSFRLDQPLPLRVVPSQMSLGSRLQCPTTSSHSRGTMSFDSGRCDQDRGIDYHQNTGTSGNIPHYDLNVVALPIQEHEDDDDDDVV